MANNKLINRYKANDQSIIFVHSKKRSNTLLKSVTKQKLKQLGFKGKKDSRHKKGRHKKGRKGHKGKKGKKGRKPRQPKKLPLLQLSTTGGRNLNEKGGGKTSASISIGKGGGSLTSRGLPLSSSKKRKIRRKTI